MKDRYIYPAIFDYANDGISIEFPDIPGCLPCGSTTEEAMNNAQEALALHLYSLEKDGDEIPNPSDPKSLKLEPNQVITLIEAWMPVYRDAIENYSVKKTLTIPKWLNDVAEEKKVNFSQVLQTALKNHLGIEKRKGRV